MAQQKCRGECDLRDWSAPPARLECASCATGVRLLRATLVAIHRQGGSSTWCGQRFVFLGAFLFVPFILGGIVAQGRDRVQGGADFGLGQTLPLLTCEQSPLLSIDPWS